MTVRTNWGMPSDFSFDDSVATIRFWLMMSFRKAGEKRWEEIFNHHYKELVSLISEHISDTLQKEKLLTLISTRAYNTIPREFFQNLKISQEQPKEPMRVISKKKKRR